MWKSLLFILCITLISCSGSIKTEDSTSKIDKEENKKSFVQVMQKHLDAVTNKDLATLKSTMAPDGKMQLILPATEIMASVDSFMAYHEAWFQDTTWDFETKILNTEISDDLGMAIVEIVYSEPERNGEPYWNRMNISYTLQKYDGVWKIIKDHASSVEKSTDKN